MENTAYRKLLSRRETADWLGVQEHTLATWASTKRYDLKVTKVGGRAMYDPQDVEAFITSRKSNLETVTT